MKAVELYLECLKRFVTVFFSQAEITFIDGGETEVSKMADGRFSQAYLEASGKIFG